MLSFYFSLPVLILLSPCLQWPPAWTPFIPVDLRAQLTSYPPVALGLSSPRHQCRRSLQLFLAKLDSVFLLVSPWFLLLTLFCSSTRSSMSFVFSASYVWPCCWLVLWSGVLSVPLVQLPDVILAHTSTQCSFCIDLGCPTLAHCPKSQAWAQPCSEDWNNLAENKTSPAGRGSPPMCVVCQQTLAAPGCDPSSPELPLPGDDDADVSCCSGFLESSQTLVSPPPATWLQEGHLCCTAGCCLLPLPSPRQSPKMNTGLTNGILGQLLRLGDLFRERGIYIQTEHVVLFVAILACWYYSVSEERGERTHHHSYAGPVESTNIASAVPSLSWLILYIKACGKQRSTSDLSTKIKIFSNPSIFN